MIGFGEVRSNLILLEVGVSNDVVLSAIQRTGLNGGVHVTLAHGRTHAAHLVHHLNHGVGLHDTDLHTGQIRRRGDGLFRIHTAGPEAVSGQHGKARGLSGGVQIVQSAGLENLLLMLHAVVHIRASDNGKVGVYVLHQRVCDDSHFHGAAFHQFQRFLLGTQLLVGIDLDGIATVGGVIQLVAQFQHRLCLGVVDRLVEGAFENGLPHLCAVRGRSGGRCRCAAGSRTTGSRTTGSRTAGSGSITAARGERESHGTCQ